MTKTNREAFEAWWGQPPQELIQCAKPDEALSMWVWQAWQAGAQAERDAQPGELCPACAASEFERVSGFGGLT